MKVNRGIARTVDRREDVVTVEGAKVRSAQRNVEEKPADVDAMAAAASGLGGRRCAGVASGVVRGAPCERRIGSCRVLIPAWIAIGRRRSEPRADFCNRTFAEVQASRNLAVLSSTAGSGQMGRR